MDLQKSLIHKKLESKVLNMSTPLSPLRRSLNVQNPFSSIISENDDEAERLARRREICSSTPLSSHSGPPRRKSLNMGFLANIPEPQMAECIQKCIKLNAENKINVKNAFSLEMIDFMTYMIKKQDANMSSLQVASTSLDVSTKIYGFRVDSVYTEILKIVGGLDKQTADDAKQNSEEEEEALQENVEANEVQKKRKKAKQKVFSTVEALKGNIEIVKPMSMMIGEGDLQTSDMFYQAALPNHVSSGFYQHPYNDVFLDVAEDKNESQNNIKCYIPVIEEFSNLEICATYSNFDFLNWSVENEPEEMLTVEAEHTDEDDDRFQFDVNASVEQDDNPEPEPMNYFDIEDDENSVHEFHQKTVIRQAENVTDAYDVQISLNTSEYSFMQPHGLHWAGPFHWKFRNIARFAGGATAGATAGANVKVVGACMQAPQRKRKQIELSYENDNCDVLDAKFMSSKSNKLHAKTAKIEWIAKNIVLPEDVHYDIANMMHKLYLHQLNINLKHDREKQNGDDAVNIANISDNERYDYNNPNDTLDYCANVNNSDYDNMDKDNCNSEDDNAPLSSSQAFTGDNLVVAPKLANKISIVYCSKAKKVDMRQLKKSIWTCLKSPNNTADVINIQKAMEEATTSTMKDSKEFSNVYKMLPKLLTKNNAEALSVPISFISLLHLANEKNLKIYSLSNMSDIIIEAGTERG